MNNNQIFFLGSDERKIEKATQLNLDCVVLDLEDGVAINQKENARKLILQSLKTKKFGRAGILYDSIDTWLGCGYRMRILLL